jgi:hypothetical protein
MAEIQLSDFKAKLVDRAIIARDNILEPGVLIALVVMIAVGVISLAIPNDIYRAIMVVILIMTFAILSVIFTMSHGN